MIKTFKGILCAVAVMGAHGWADVREEFIGNDNNVYYLRHATTNDFESAAEQLD
ncbi:MAG: hypothetical protein V4544_04055 [Pseudomonadota bacterium]